jgi:glycosyltransferase involved in cell wall biosynthesis
MTVSIPMAGMNASGGVKTLLLLANAMADRGWSVRVLLPQYASDGPFALAPAVERLVLRTPSSGILRVPVYYARLARHAARGADLCLANFYLTSYCAVLSWLTNRRARVVYFVQGDEASSHGRLADVGVLSRAVRWALARLSYRLPVRIICVSRWLRHRIGRPDARVVTQALDLDVFAPDRRPSGGTVVIGTIGSSAKTKGYADFCRALDLVPDAVRRGVRVIVAGPASVPLPAGVAAERVETTSEAGMSAFYNRCDIFVFASRSEGFGLPPLEAMACGCAVVTTDCGGVRDYVEPGTNAWMVAPAEPSELAAAIAVLAVDVAQRERLARAAVVTARARGRDEMIAEFMDALTA